MNNSIFSDDFYNNVLNSKKDREVPMLYDYLIDISNGHLILDDKGQATIVSGLDAIICQAYRKINTKKGKFNIYSKKYGSRLFELLGQGKVFADDFAQQFLIDCLVDKKYVYKIVNFQSEFKGSTYTIYFQMDTIYGTTPYYIQDVEISYD